MLLAENTVLLPCFGEQDAGMPVAHNKPARGHYAHLQFRCRIRVACHWCWPYQDCLPMLIPSNYVKLLLFAYFVNLLIYMYLTIPTVGWFQIENSCFCPFLIIKHRNTISVCLPPIHQLHVVCVTKWHLAITLWVNFRLQFHSKKYI